MNDGRVVEVEVLAAWIVIPLPFTELPTPGLPLKRLEGGTIAFDRLSDF